MVGWVAAIEYTLGNYSGERELLLEVVSSSS